MQQLTSRFVESEVVVVDGLVGSVGEASSGMQEIRCYVSIYKAIFTFQDSGL